MPVTAQRSSNGNGVGRCFTLSKRTHVRGAIRSGAWSLSATRGTRPHRRSTVAKRSDHDPPNSPAARSACVNYFAANSRLAQADGAAREPTGRLLVMVAVVGASMLLPGIVHLRLGAALSGCIFLLVTGVLSVIQFAAPFVEPTARAALLSGIAFALGWLVSVAAARSAARLMRV